MLQYKNRFLSLHFETTTRNRCVGPQRALAFQTRAKKKVKSETQEVSKAHLGSTAGRPGTPGSPENISFRSIVD